MNILKKYYKKILFILIMLFILVYFFKINNIYIYFFNIFITFFLFLITFIVKNNIFVFLNNFMLIYEFLLIKFAYLLKNLVFNSNKFYYFLVVLPKIFVIILILLNISPVFQKIPIYIGILMFSVIFLVTNIYIRYLEKLNKLLIHNLKKKVETITTKYEQGIHPSEWPENFDPDDEDADDILEDMRLPLDIFINYYVKKYVEDNIEIKYKYISIALKHFDIKYNIHKKINIFSNKNYRILFDTQKKNNDKQLKTILYLSTFLAYYKKSCNNLGKDLELLLFFFINSCLFFVYIFFRFIKPRLPKDIPISLDEFYFYILLIICIVYIYIIYRLMKPKIPSPFVLSVIQKITYPFHYIRKKFIYHPTFYPYYYEFLYKNILIKFLHKTSKEHFYIILTYKFLPKVILILILILDIIIFQKIQLFYYFLFLNIISTIFYSLIYNIKTGEEHLLEQLEQRYEHVEIREKFNNIPKEFWDHKIKLYGRDKFERLTFEEKYEFLSFQENNLPKYINDVSNTDFIGGKINHHPNAIYHYQNFSIRNALNIIYYHRLTFDNTDPYQYIYDDYPEVFFPILDEYRKTHNKLILYYEDYCVLRKQYYDYSEVIYNIRKFNTKYDFVEKDYKILPLTIGIYIMTLFCWVFILGVSLYVFPPSFEYTLIFFDNMLENLMNEEPFSLSQMYEQPSIQKFMDFASINEK